MGNELADLIKRATTHLVLGPDASATVISRFRAHPSPPAGCSRSAGDGRYRCSHRRATGLEVRSRATHRPGRSGHDVTAGTAKSVGVEAALGTELRWTAHHRAIRVAGRGAGTGGGWAGSGGFRAAVGVVRIGTDRLRARDDGSLRDGALYLAGTHLRRRPPLGRGARAASSARQSGKRARPDGDVRQLRQIRRCHGWLCLRPGPVGDS